MSAKMNRTIKFRGKDLIHNKWIYGGLAEDRNDNAVILPKNNWQKGGCVDKDTIGQFTGFYDENGERIYEGDIVKFPHVGECTRGIIVWNEKVGAWCIKLKGENSLGSTPVGEMLSSYTIEVVGNIHDNPELIKEEQE